MRSLFVINSPIVGGAERHTFDLAAALRARGFESSIFAMRPGPLDSPDGSPLDRPPPGRSLAGRVRDLARHIGAAPDLIVAVNERPAVAAMMARRLARRPRARIVMIWHSTRVRDAKEATLSRLQRPLLNRLDGITFLCETQRAFWRLRGMRPRREATILNGVDLARYAPETRTRWRQATRDAIGCANSTLLLGLCAVMRPEKNHCQLIEAVARLRGRGIDARALLVGDGPSRPAIEARAAALGVAGQTHITGMASDVRPWLSAFDIGVSCSTSIETLSLSTLEAMAMGVPVVISALGGAAEIVDGVNGRIFPVRDLDGLCAAIESLRTPETLAIAGRAARASALARFDQRAMVDGYFAWFNSLAAGP